MAVATTVVLMLAIGTSSLHLFDNGGRATQAAVRTTFPRDDRRVTSTDSTPSSTVVATVSTAPTTTTEAPSSTTKPMVPGLNLPNPPTPTPMGLPATGLAPVISRVTTTNKVIFLGIDDGLTRDPQVLALLRQAKVPVTMFLVQSQADAGEDFWKQVQEVGGVVESHTITHPDLTKLSASQLQREVCGTLDDYEARFGRRPTLFRPPYGFYNDNVRQVAASCGFKALVMWKGATNDGRLDLQEGPNLQPGDVILMHWRPDLYQDLLTVFQRCRDEGYAIARLEDYIK